MSADWKPGDLAVCVNNAECVTRPNSGRKAPLLLQKGAIYCVERVGLLPSGCSGFNLAGVPRVTTQVVDWAASRFRKVTPDKPEACEEEFTTLLNRIKRTVQA